MRRWVSAIGLVLTLCAAGLEPPIPGPFEPSKNGQPQATQEQQKPSEDTRGTNQTPLIVKIAPSPDAYPETEDARQERKKKSTEDGWLLVWAKVTAIATVLLFIATAGLWVFTALLWNTTRKAVAGGESAVEAAVKAAAAASRHVEHAAKAAEAMQKLAETAAATAQSTHASVTLATNEFNLVNRAHLSIEGFTIDGTGGLPGHIILKFTLRNSGRLPATNVTMSTFNGTSHEYITPSEDAVYIARNPAWDSRVIAPGESAYCEERTPGFTFDEFADCHARELHLQLAVFMTYIDGFNKERITSKWFWYDPQLRVFRERGARQD